MPSADAGIYCNSCFYTYPDHSIYPYLYTAIQDHSSAKYIQTIETAVNWANYEASLAPPTLFPKDGTHKCRMSISATDKGMNQIRPGYINLYLKIDGYVVELYQYVGAIPGYGYFITVGYDISSHTVGLLRDAAYNGVSIEIQFVSYEGYGAGGCKIAFLDIETPDPYHPSTSSSLSSSSSSTEVLTTSSSSSKSSGGVSQSSSSSYSSPSSSSKSSFSSSSKSSSSSSSDDYVTRLINSAVINQNNGDLIPFNWTSESGVSGDVGDNSVLNFSIESSSSPNFDYSAIISGNNSALNSNSSSTPTIFVPNSDSDKYKHENSFYVDVIAKDISGIKEIRAHVEPNKYGFTSVAEAGQTFMVPKFTWK